MQNADKRWQAVFSSDWNECLAPCGPFDAVAHSHPELQGELDRVFRQYTSNRLSLSAAVWQVQRSLPRSVSVEQMDAYLGDHFQTYPGVADLIEWCAANRVLFMINTTGLIGYFQRVFAKGLLPPVPVLSAHPMVRYEPSATDPVDIYELFETRDKGAHTAAVVEKNDIPPQRVFVMGDSGGDGPHFKWGAETGAVCIGSMTKPSLEQYCRQHRITIDFQVGHTYREGEAKDPAAELTTDFTELIGFIEKRIR